MTEDARLSDEATGLPPLSDIEDATTILLLAWDASVGVARSPWTDETQPVRYLHVRGLAQGAEGPSDVPDWVQVFVAVPVEHALDVAADLAKGSTESLGDEGGAAEL